MLRKVAIIGAGAAGLMCGIHAVSKHTEVVLFDKNSVAGKKLLATGNGRCNYWNSDQDFSHYHSSEEDLLPSIITKDLQEEVLKFFDSLGVVPNIKNGYYYPYSNQASSIRDLLVMEARKRGVLFSFDTEILDLYKEQEKFVVVDSQGKEYFDDLVIATGSKASPKTGSTGDGYSFAEKFHHRIFPVKPALVQLKTDGKFLQEWSGVRASCCVSLYEDGEFVKMEEGEIQLTDYGVSGICIFNLSRYVSLGIPSKKESLKISFLPFLKDKTKEEIFSWLDQRGETLKDSSMVEFLEGCLPYKLISVLLDCAHISKQATWKQLSSLEKERFYSTVFSFPLNVLGTKDFSHAQVCCGGVLLSEVSSKLESRLVPHLYFVGEVLDVDGDCGGYNLGFSWMSGILVGKTIRGDQL